MRTPKLLIYLVAFSACLPAQRIFYDGERDKRAQDAVIAGKEITSGSLFQKMLSNVDLQAKAEAADALRWTEKEMIATINNFQVWKHRDDKPGVTLPIPGQCGFAIEKRCKSVRCEMEAIEVQMEVDTPQEANSIAERLKQIKAQQERLKAVIAELAKTSKSQDPVVLEILSHAGDVEEIVKYAQGLTSASPTAGKVLGQISETLSQIESLYKSVQAIWAGYKAIENDVLMLRPAIEAVQLRLLGAEEEHLKAVAMIYARRLRESDEVRKRVDMAKARLTKYWESEDAVGATLSKLVDPADRNELVLVSMGLHEAAAAAAQGAVACRLAALRSSDEQRRHSVRVSAIHADTYDQTIQSALTRLAVYYKGGIKRAELAQFIFNVVGTVSLPAIAFK